MKKTSVLFIVGLAIIIGTTVFLYYRRISSPAYSLEQIQLAYAEHDITKFKKYVDTRTLINRVLDKTLHEISEKNTDSTRSERLSEDMGRGLINLFRPQVEELWTNQIYKLVETGDIEGEKGKKGLDEFWNKNDTATFNGIREVKQDGKIATVYLEFIQPRFDTTLELEVKMRDRGSYWQLFDISNFFDYGKTLEALEDRRVNGLNEEVKKQFLTHIKLSNVTVTTELHGHTAEYYSYTYTLDFENIGDKGIDEITCFFDIINSVGRRVRSGVVTGKLDLEPGQKYTHQEINPISFEKINPQGLTVKIELAELHFKDGSKLEWQGKWADLIKKK